jgi:hypothetical protein
MASLCCGNMNKLKNCGNGKARMVGELGAFCVSINCLTVGAVPVFHLTISVASLCLGNVNELENCRDGQAGMVGELGAFCVRINCFTLRAVPVFHLTVSVASLCLGNVNELCIGSDCKVLTVGYLGKSLVSENDLTSGIGAVPELSGAFYVASLCCRYVSDVVNMLRHRHFFLESAASTGALLKAGVINGSPSRPVMLRGVGDNTLGSSGCNNSESCEAKNYCKNNCCKLSHF